MKVILFSFKTNAYSQGRLLHFRILGVITAMTNICRVRINAKYRSATKSGFGANNS